MMRTDLLPVTKGGKLAKLNEESAEVIAELALVVKCISKLERFGETATDPITHVAYNNVGDLLRIINKVRDEIADFNSACEAVIEMYTTPH